MLTNWILFEFIYICANERNAKLINDGKLILHYKTNA